MYFLEFLGKEVNFYICGFIFGSLKNKKWEVETSIPKLSKLKLKIWLQWGSKYLTFKNQKHSKTKHSKNRPFGMRTNFHHLKSGLVRYSIPHYIWTPTIRKLDLLNTVGIWKQDMSRFQIPIWFYFNTVGKVLKIVLGIK